MLLLISALILPLVSLGAATPSRPAPLNTHSYSCSPWSGTQQDQSSGLKIGAWYDDFGRDAPTCPAGPSAVGALLYDRPLVVGDGKGASIVAFQVGPSGMAARTQLDFSGPTNDDPCGRWIQTFTELKPEECTVLQEKATCVRLWHW